MSAYEERPVIFDCLGNELLGIVAVPKSVAVHRTGVVVVVGGPQYRVGSHRQFTFLCRHLAERGIASIRFDYHGLGDSDGPPALGVDGVEPDLRVAIDVFMRQAPGLTAVVLWGLCGAASASALYAPTDARVNGLVMLNPWVRTEEGLAKARLRHYYLGRLGDREFWSRIARGDVAVGSALRAFGASVVKASGWGRGGRARAVRSVAGDAVPEEAGAGALPVRMLASLQRARLPALVVLSGDADLTANEFRQVAGGSAGWRRWMRSAAVECHVVEGSNHTFSRTDWRDQVAELTARWVKAR
jgi:uncharacterized protein